MPQNKEQILKIFHNIYRMFANKFSRQARLSIKEEQGSSFIYPSNNPDKENQPVADGLVLLCDITFNPELINISAVARKTDFSQSYVSELINKRRHNKRASIIVRNAIISLYNHAIQFIPEPVPPLQINDNIPNAVFSTMELKIGASLVNGINRKQIAAENNLTFSGFTVIVDAMRAQCGAQNRAELIAFLKDNNLV